MNKEKVVITGLGVISPIGQDIPTFWHHLIDGETGIDRLTRFDVTEFSTQFGAEVRNFDPLRFMDKKVVRESDLFIQFALAAALMAVEDSGQVNESVTPERFGITMGNCVGGLMTLLETIEEMSTRGIHRVSPRFITKWIPNMACNTISTLVGSRGPSLTVSTACASSNNALGMALQAIQRGEADVMLAGGSESLFAPLVLAGLGSARALSRRNEDPRGACRPFDAERDGMVMGEGAAFVVMESLTHAVNRGARIYCELAGYATNGEGYNATAPAPDGRGEILAMHSALADASMQPTEIDYINAHGTSTPVGDEVETLAIKQVFGQHAYNIPVSSIKASTGHLLGAAGAVEFVATVLALYHGILPPTLNYQSPDPACDLDYVPNEARRVSIGAALSNSFGFGGQNASVVIRRVET